MLQIEWPNRLHVLRFGAALGVVAVCGLMAGCASSGGSLMRSGSSSRAAASTTMVATAPAPRERVYGATHAEPLAKDGGKDGGKDSGRGAGKVPAKEPAPAPATETAPAKDAAGRRVIEVQPGETLLAIAQQHRVSVAELMSVNRLKSIAVTAGQRLAIPKR